MKNSIKQLLSKKELFYFIIIFMLIFHNYTYNIYGLNLRKISMLILGTTTILFGISVIKDIKNNFKNLFLYFTVIFMLIFGIRSLYLSFFVLGISVFVDKKLTTKYFLQISTFFYVLTIFLYKIGYLSEVENPLTRLENIRYSLGFAHPNTAMMFLLPIFSLIYYLYYPKYKKSIIFSMVSISLAVFFVTFSRTTFILMIIFLILIFLNDKIIDKLKNLFLLEGFIIVLFSLIFPFIFSRENIFNRLLSGRLSLFQIYLTTKKITVFGDMEVLKGYLSLPLDNSYLRILFENGAIGFILLLILNYAVMRLLFKNKDYKAIRIYSILLILAFMEGGAFSFYLNILCVILPTYMNEHISQKYIK